MYSLIQDVSLYLYEAAIELFSSACCHLCIPQFSSRWQIQSEGLRSRKSGMTIYTRGEGQVHHSPLTTGPSVATVASETHRESEEVLILGNGMS